MLRLYAFTCGWLTGPLGLFLRGESGRLRVPVPCYLVDHPRGRLLFDSGMHPALAEDAEARIGDEAKIFSVELATGEDVAPRLEAVDLDPGRIDWVVNSHLHFDHAGGNALLPNARVLLQKAEWEAARDPDGIAANFYHPVDYDTGQEVVTVEGEHDVFGDGSVVCVPTPGHTPGHQSLRVRLAGGDVVLTGDACYLRRTLEALHLPAIAHDEAAMLRSLERLRALRDAGARIFYGHDPEFWAKVPQGPDAVG